MKLETTWDRYVMTLNPCQRDFLCALPCGPYIDRDILIVIFMG